MRDLLRRRLRLGIGGMMLAILVFGLWLGNQVNRAREQRVAVAAVKAAGGWVLYADEFVMGPVNIPAGNGIWKPSWGTLTPGKSPAAAGRMQGWIGDEYLREIVHVSLFVDIQKGMAGAPGSDQKPVDDVLLALGNQSSVRTLQMGGETVTDKGLGSVAGMTDLRELFLWWATGITDAGVAHLSRLPRLRIVDINNSSLTDESVRQLAELPALEELSLQGRKCTDQSLIYLSRAKQLKSLVLMMDVSEISDKGLEHLKGLKNLRRLHLGKSKISKEARERLLKAIPNLEFIP